MNDILYYLSYKTEDRSDEDNVYFRGLQDYGVIPVKSFKQVCNFMMLLVY
ncbi:MAG: hypothetical protein FWF50_00235 [Defluviitaleaceae bacterium]|nr:hypothetical protein [Defluviitaleaceae bacterium]